MGRAHTSSSTGSLDGEHSVECNAQGNKTSKLGSDVCFMCTLLALQVGMTLLKHAHVHPCECELESYMYCTCKVNTCCAVWDYTLLSLGLIIGINHTQTAGKDQVLHVTSLLPCDITVNLHDVITIVT